MGDRLKGLAKMAMLPFFLLLGILVSWAIYSGSK